MPRRHHSAATCTLGTYGHLLPGLAWPRHGTRGRTRGAHRGPCLAVTGHASGTPRDRSRTYWRIDAC